MTDRKGKFTSLLLLQEEFSLLQTCAGLRTVGLIRSTSKTPSLPLSEPGFTDCGWTVDFIVKGLDSERAISYIST